MTRVLTHSLALVAAALLCSTVMATAPADYRVLNRAKLGGNEGWDCLFVDAQGRRVYISHGTRVLVVDADHFNLVGEIADTPGVHGIAVAPKLHRGFTSNGRDDTVTVFDTMSLKALDRVKVGQRPDVIVFEPASNRVFTFNAGSHDTTAIDAATGKVVGTVAFGGKPEFAVFDEKGAMFVNIEDTSEIVQIDSRDLSVVKRFPLKPGEGPTGLAIDVRHHRLFSVCGNKLMTVLDSRSGQVIATVPIGQGPDGAGFDPPTGLAFSSNGEGTVTVVGEVSPGRFAVVQTVKTQKSARTMDLDPTTHRLYLAAAELGPAPAATPETPRSRPPMVKGSFVVIVVGN